MSVQQLVGAMGWREFQLWQEYMKQYPPDRGEQLRTAALMACITNMSGKSMPEGKRVTTRDFLPEDDPLNLQTQDQTLAFMRAMFN